jgi:hypothetical protein
MTTMTQSIPRFTSRQHHPATIAMLALLFWLIAAVLVVAAHIEIDPRSPAAAAAASIAALAATAYGYNRLVARHAGITHALGVGIAWLVLSIGVEITLATRLGHGWYSLLGSPAHPLMRNVYLFVWIFAPAFFAEREEMS